MGGLVVKKAYILGQNDAQYTDLIKSACAILFLSTPHRGTNLAELLNRILSVSVFNHSAKQYIAELKQNSPALQDINEQFRNIAPRLQIFSFFETQQTAVGPKTLMVLEKDSSILGYPDEVSKALDADHHNVCKYTSQQDPNYVSVRNALKSLVSKFSENESSVKSLFQEIDMGRIELLLSVTDAPEDDFDYFRSRWMPGSCGWVLSHPKYISWSDDASTLSSILRVEGLPGSGKSIIAAFLVNELRNTGRSCQYFFFRFGDRDKRSVNCLLRSLAFQIAKDHPEVRSRLEKLSVDGVRFEKVEGRMIWQKLFASILFKIRLARPIFWVIDGIDECESSQALLNLLSTISSSRVTLRIMLVGRRTQSQEIAFQRLTATTRVNNLLIDDTTDDLESYITREIAYMHWSQDFKARMVQKICSLAAGNFLWVHLVVKEISQCHTEAAIEQALEELPAELEPLYQRMELALSRVTRPGDKELARTVLTWVICSQRSLTLEELTEALRPEYSSILDFRHTISQVCGDFIVIDSKNRVGMVHQTAREYLIRTSGLEHSIEPWTGHQELSMKCISFLLSHGKRIKQSSTQPFLLYAATSWPYHLESSAISMENSVLLALSQFLRGTSVLTWIHVLASVGQLRVLVHAAQSLTVYLRKKARIDSESSPLTHRLQEKDMLSLWAIDLVKIVGKFGSHLLRHPKSIYSLVPAFCPTESIIHQQFGPRKSREALSLGGFRSSTWDDCLSKFIVARDTQLLRITCTDRFFSILTSDGTLRCYRAATFEPIQRFSHGERILAFKFSHSCDKLVTYSFRTTKVWDVPSRRQLQSIPNPSGTKALDLVFSPDEVTILSCSDDRAIRALVLNSQDPSWRITNPCLGGDSFDGRRYNSPRRVSFNPAGNQIAVAYRGFPLLVWGVDVPELVSRCERESDRNRSRQDLQSEIGPICWNPATGHVLGLYMDGCIFKWHPLDYDSQEIRTVASEIDCGLDGNLFVTSTTDGTLKIWSFHHFTLIYQLSCHSPVTDLALSPDGRRVYDLRESVCSVWEPNALIRIAEADEKASETSSTVGGSTQISMVSESSSEMLEPLTALAVGSQTSSYCSGDDVGIIRLCRRSGKEITHISQGFMPADFVVWSDDEKYVVTADLSGRLSIRAMDISTPTASSSLVFEAKAGTGLLQILISRSNEYLLVVTVGFTELWSLSGKNLIVTQPNNNPCARWINHPIEADSLIQLTFSEIKTCHWSTLFQQSSASLILATITPDHEEANSYHDDHRRSSAGRLMSPDENQDTVDEAFVTIGGTHIVLSTSQATDQRWRRRRFFILRSTDLKPQDPDAIAAISPRPIPQTVSSRIEKILGVLKEESLRETRSFLSHSASQSNLLAFLDKEYWVCTWAFGDDAVSDGKVKRHFFLPQDWLSPDCVRLATVSKDGIFYCPRNGEVAIVRNGLREEWID